MTELDDLDEQLDAAKLPERTVEICLRSDLVEEYKQLRGELAEQSEDSLASGGTNKDLEALEAKIRKATTAFTLRALPRKEYRALVKAHPADKNDPRDRATGFNVDTFIADLLRKCTVSPQMTESRWDKMELVLSQGQWDKLHAVAHLVNSTEANVPF